MNINLSQKENYVYNARPNKRKISMMTREMAWVDTVENMKCIYRSKEDAALARQAQMRMRYPSVKDIVESINNGRVLNLPQAILITLNEYGEEIWGP